MQNDECEKGLLGEKHKRDISQKSEISRLCFKEVVMSGRSPGIMKLDGAILAYILTAVIN